MIVNQYFGFNIRKITCFLELKNKCFGIIFVAINRRKLFYNNRLETLKRVLDFVNNKNGRSVV